MAKNQLNLSDADQGKTIAIISYLTIIGLIAALVMNNNKSSSLGRFHIRQSIGLTLTAIPLGLFSYIPVVGGIISMVLGVIVLIALVLGLLNAINGQEKGLPVVGDLYHKWFSFI